MKHTLYLLLFSILFISCSSDDEQVQQEENTPLKIEGRQAFSIDFKEVTVQNSSNKTVNALVPAYVLISINDKNGEIILTREKIAINIVNDKYVTEEISLEVDTYSLTEFIVVDTDNVVVSLAPKVNSVLSQFIENTLPFNFTVETDKSSVVSIENMDAKGYTSFDFGYDELSLIIPESTDFFSFTIDESMAITPKTIVIKSITASNYIVDWGDGNIEEYLSTTSDNFEEKELTHTYALKNIYNVTISGALAVIEEFKFYSNNETGSPLQSNITSVDIDKLTLLKKCHIYNGKLSTLSTSKNVALETLELGYNQITSLDVTNNVDLKTAWLRHNQLTEFDVSENLKLEFLWITGNQISNLNLSNNTALNKVLVRDNKLTSCNISNSLELEVIDCSDNLITSIDLSNNTGLVEINVGANKLTSVDLSKNTNVTRIDLYDNQINNIDLSFNLKLKNLYINDNLLNTIDLSNNPDIDRLIIDNNNLNSLDITNNPKIFNLEIGGNQFTGDKLDQMITLVYDQAVLNSTMQGYIDFQNNPGFNNIVQTTTDKINELEETYMWSFNNNFRINRRNNINATILPCGQIITSNRSLLYK